MLKTLTITLNPSIDKSISVPTLVADQKLHCGTAAFEPGGGGINVSRAIQKLGGISECWFLAGGYYGDFLIQLVRQQGLHYKCFPIANETRECIIAYDETSRKQYLFDLEGPFVTEHEWQPMLAAIVCEKHRQFLVLSGSVPPGVPQDFYGQAARLAKANGMQVIADTSGLPLELVLKEGIFLLKPNLREFCLLTGADPDRVDDIQLKAKALIHSGACQIVVISLGKNGAFLIGDNYFVHIPAPTVERKSTVGAGDSMVAGLIYQLSNGNDILKAVQYGVGCGAAATIYPGTSLCRKADAELFFNCILENQNYDSF